MQTHQTHMQDVRSYQRQNNTTKEITEEAWIGAVPPAANCAPQVMFDNPRSNYYRNLHAADAITLGEALVAAGRRAIQAQKEADKAAKPESLCVRDVLELARVTRRSVTFHYRKDPGRSVAFHYRKDSPEVEKRTVRVDKLTDRLVEGLDLDKGAPRSFRLDRIVNVQL